MSELIRFYAWPLAVISILLLASFLVGVWIGFRLGVWVGS